VPARPIRGRKDFSENAGAYASQKTHYNKLRIVFSSQFQVPIELLFSFAKAREDTFLSDSERKVAERGGFEPPVRI
jgi:hypothetical protein